MPGPRVESPQLAAVPDVLLLKAGRGIQEVIKQHSHADLQEHPAHCHLERHDEERKHPVDGAIGVDDREVGDPRVPHRKAEDWDVGPTEVAEAGRVTVAKLGHPDDGVCPNDTMSKLNTLYSATESFYNINIPSNFFSNGYIDVELYSTNYTSDWLYT